MYLQWLPFVTFKSLYNLIVMRYTVQGRKVCQVTNLDFLYNGICSRPWPGNTRTKTEISNCPSPGNQQPSFYFPIHLLNPIANMAANYKCI